MQVPKSISKRLSENPSAKAVFDKSKMLYEKSLNNSGFNENLIYHQENENKKQNKKIKIVKANTGKTFLKLINRYFLKHHKTSKIFNENALKLS